MKASTRTPETGRGGFSLVEVVIAFLILAVGVLGLAGTTAFVVRQVTIADVATERAARVQEALERLRALPFDSVKDGSDTLGDYTVEWTVEPGNLSKIITVVTTGPGLTTGTGDFPAMGNAVSDTFSYRILKP